MLKKYGFYKSKTDKALKEYKKNNDIYTFYVNLFKTSTQKVDGLCYGVINLFGVDVFLNDIKRFTKLSYVQVEKAWRQFEQDNLNNILLTGSEAVALTLRREGVEFVFAYPGTSELMLCDAVNKVSGVKLVNGRGDKEAAFMAAGGSMTVPLKAACILHGARGLTNAGGAIADSRRNEIATLCIVGLPSTASIKFLPPHGERDLIKNIGTFAKACDEVAKFWHDGESEAVRTEKSTDFMRKLNAMILRAKELPRGPTLFGIPQDVAEKQWIPYDVWVRESSNVKTIFPEASDLNKAAEIFNDSENCIILVDDYLFKDPSAKDQLKAFVNKFKIPIFQVGYKRGPMFFEMLNKLQNPYFIGSYDPGNAKHLELMNKADLLITLEDRNMYERVVGKLPNCKKIAITSNPEKTLGNGYITSLDICLYGPVVEILEKLISMFQKKTGSKINSDQLKEYVSSYPEINKKYEFLRKEAVKLIAKVLSSELKPVIVDDSQMFGAIFTENYDNFPDKLRVFGDHGAFIGGGLSLSAGLALCNPELTVICNLGDQSFTNALQGLVSVYEQQINIVYLVCNNGKSVSLNKQILSQDTFALDSGEDKFLKNSGIDYSKIAGSFGIQTHVLNYNPDNNLEDSSETGSDFYRIFKESVKKDGPVLIELRVPSTPIAWDGIWQIKGNEKKP